MFTVYSRDNCGFCVKAYDLLEKKGETYKSEKLDTDEKVQAFIAKGFKQVPQIYHNDEHIGGYDKLEAWYAAREVDDSAFDE
jgi:glutaredoxin